MPSVFGKESKKQQLINNLGDTYREIERLYSISPGDFPPMKHMKEVLQDMDFTKFHQLKPKLIEKLDLMLSRDMTRLMQMVPQEEAQSSSDGANVSIRGGVFVGNDNPFGAGSGEGADYGKGELNEWVVAEKKHIYDALFESLSPINGKVSGTSAKKQMLQSKLPNTVLGRIWKLSDVDRDGMLDSDEFAVAQHLISIKLDGHDIPEALPRHLVPPSKRPFAAESSFS